MSLAQAWGDGFAADAWFPLTTVTQASDLSEGEAVRFAPALRRRSGGLSPQIVSHVLRRAAEIETSLGAPETARPLETREAASWLRSLAASEGRVREITDLRQIARFAFLTGLHPAYVWPIAETAPNWGAAAAWLGEWSRRGRAFMPIEVADYLLDALAPKDGGVIWRDASLGELLRDDASPAILLEAAKRRVGGEVAEVRRPALRPRSATLSRAKFGLASFFSGAVFGRTR